jgi:hypothetical protein
MDRPTIGIDAGGKQNRVLTIVAICICIAAVIVGLIDLISGYHRVASTCASAAFACYFANKLWPHRGFPIGAVILSAGAISAFFLGTK